MSNRKTDIEQLRRDLLAIETAIIDLNRKLTAAIVAKQTAGNLTSELSARMDDRDRMVERLKRLNAAQ
jgi:hypothetical protein